MQERSEVRLKPLVKVTCLLQVLQLLKVDLRLVLAPELKKRLKVTYQVLR
jgi:hypothetical protein